MRPTLLLPLLLVTAQSPSLAADPPTPPFTLSHDTTLLTTPLRADGTIDYLAAWNARTANAITPDQNGWLRFEQAVGGFPGDDEALRLAGARIPEGATPWTYFEDFLQQQGFPPAAIQDARPRAATAESSVWNPKDQPALAQYLAFQKQKLDAVVSAADLAKWWEPAIQRGVHRTLGHAVLPVGPARGVAELLSTRAMLRAGQGDLAGFLSDISAAKRLARHVARQGTVGIAAAAAIETVLNRALGFVASEGRLTEPQCAQVQKMLDEQGEIGGFQQAIDVWDRWCALDDVQEVALGRSDACMVTDPANVDWNAVLTRINRSEDEELWIVGLRSATDQNEAAKARQNRLAQTSSTPRPSPTTPQRFTKTPTETPAAYTDRIGAALEQAFVPDETPLAETLRRTQLEATLLRTLLTAAAHRAHNGTWPATLDDVLPSGENQPLDALGNPLTYTLTNRGPQLTGKTTTATPITLGAPAFPPHSP